MPSLEKVFGGLKFLLEWLILLGQARGKILTLDNLRRIFILSIMFHVQEQLGIGGSLAPSLLLCI